jgi:hypothetical protein
MAGREHHLPHTLVPLALAVSVVRSRVAAVAGADPDAVATLIASAVPVFEYWDTPLRLPQPLANILREGVFRDAGRELHFVDGRPTKYRLAVRAADVDCVIEMLMHAEHAACTRNRVLRVHARELVRTSRDLAARAAALRGTTEKLLARASLVSQPAYPGAAPSP